MNESLLRRLLVLLESCPEGAALPEIAARLALPAEEAERAVRLLVRAGRLRRLHAGPGDLRYAPSARRVDPEPAPSLPPAARGKPRTLTARLLAVLSRQQAPLRAAEVVLLAGLPEDGRTVSRVSATLCMLARRGRLRRVAMPGGAVRYALPGAAADAETPLRPRDLIDAGFRPEIPREGVAPLSLAEWMPVRDGERPSAATVCQRLRRGWPPELAACLPPLRRQVA
jgi:hypothetical protein